MKDTLKVATVLPVHTWKDADSSCYFGAGQRPPLSHRQSPLIGCSHSGRGPPGTAVEPLRDLGTSVRPRQTQQPRGGGRLHAAPAAAGQLLQRPGRRWSCCSLSSVSLYLQIIKVAAVICAPSASCCKHQRAQRASPQLTLFFNQPSVFLLGKPC